MTLASSRAREASPSHRGAWLLRIGVVAALVAGTLAGVGAPAFADHDIRLGSIGNIELQVGGGAQTVTLRVENRGGLGQGHTSPDGAALNVQVTMTVPGGLGVVIASAPNGCSLSANDTRMDCTVARIEAGQTFTGVVQVAVQGNAPVPAGESRNETAQVTLANGGSQQFNVRVNGPQQAPAAGEISGIVSDQSTGEPVEGARVLLVDSQQQDFETTTNAEGQFGFAAGQVAAGGIALSASKDGYRSGGEATHNVSVNQSLGDIQLALIDTATPSPTASATPTATPTATDSPAPVAVPASSGRSFFTTLMIILGVLFVALGIGAIVLLIIRQRRRAREEDDDGGLDGADDPTSGPHGPGPVPGSRGVYRPTPTQVAGAAQTQVMGPGGTALPAVGPRPALAEAQTMLQRGMAGPADETAMLPRAGDPPGPRPPVPGTPNVRPASPAATTYGTAHAGGYPGSHAGHGADRTYGADPTGADRTYGAYDQPTGRHERPGGGYERSGAGYERPGPPGYDRPAPGYDRPAPGYEPPAPGYERPAPERAGYGADRPTYHGGESYGPDPYTPQRPSSGGHGGEPPHYPAEPASPSPAGGGYAGHRAQPGYPGAPAGGGGYTGGDPRGAGYQGGRGYEGGRAYGNGQANEDASGYGGGQPHGDASGYEQRGGYAGQGGYESPGYSGGAHGYEDRGGYGRQQPEAGGGYGAAPEYGRPAEPPAAEPDYYDDATATRPRHEQPPPERRRLDWLD